MRKKTRNDEIKNEIDFNKGMIQGRILYLKILKIVRHLILAEIYSIVQTK